MRGGVDVAPGLRGRSIIFLGLKSFCFGRRTGKRVGEVRVSASEGGDRHNWGGAVPKFKLDTHLENPKTKKGGLYLSH